MTERKSSMITETMTIHEALSELKMLDKRIQKKINDAKFCTTNRHSNSKINGKSIEDFVANVKSEYESITDLIRRRAAIRNALSISNARTTVTIAGKEYTIAEAIEMKASGMMNYELLRGIMEQQFLECAKVIERENGDKLRDAADAYVNGLFGTKEKSVNVDEIERARKTYVENHTVDLIDPLDAAKKITNLDDFIGKFDSEVDAKISISNATTTIEISY